MSIKVFLTLCFITPFVGAAGHHPQQFLQTIKGSKEEGAAIVSHFCSSCHALKPLIPLGAPRIKQEKDWTPRIQQGFPNLFKHTTEGLNAMPVRGGCFECSDEQLALAIWAMLPDPPSPKKYIKNTISKNK